ncbi:hypothetical protein RB195_008485 [Necator americanus]|uniref:Uncharacterized protein n=1 Tax=Necator americanus TaxID=51031 RepID=A0ABR1CQT0_NECAM
MSPDNRESERTRGADAIDIEYQRHFRATTSAKEEEEVTGVPEAVQRSGAHAPATRTPLIRRGFVLAGPVVSGWLDSAL